MARFLLALALAMFALALTARATAVSSEGEMQVSARHDDDDSSHMETKVKFTCSKLTSRARFMRCTRCTTRCGKRFGVKGTMIRHVNGEAGDGDDDGKEKLTRVIYLCNRNEKCLTCRAECRRRLGLKKTIMPGGEMDGRR